MDSACDNLQTKIYVKSECKYARNIIRTICLKNGNILEFIQRGNLFFIIFSKLSDAVKAIDILNKIELTHAELGNLQPFLPILPHQNETQNAQNNNNVNVQQISNRNEYQYFGSSALNAIRDVANKCIRCSKTTQNKCSTCFDHYCSVECQTLDWSKHKFNCKPVPQLLTTQEFNISTSVASSSNTANLQRHGNNNNYTNINKSIVKEERSSELQPSNNFKYYIRETVSEKKMGSIIPLASDSLVTITYVHSSTTVFCRSLQAPHNDGYAKLTAKIFQYSLKAKRLKNLPQLDEIVLAKYENCYYRAMVLRIANNSVQVIFMEFGNKEYIKLEDLKEIDSDDIKYHSAYVNRTDLCEIPRNLTAAQKEMCVNYLHSLVDEPLKILYTGQLSCEPKVKFQIIKSGQYVNDKISEIITKANTSLNTIPSTDISTGIKTITLSSEKTATTNVTEPITDICRITKDIQKNFTGYFMKDIKFKEIKTDNFELVVLDKSNILVKNGIFHAVLPQNVDDLLTYNAVLMDYDEENKTPYMPKETNELCIVKYIKNGQWYRAIFNKYIKSDNKFEVTFLDYGNVYMVEAECIRSINFFLLFPSPTITCRIKDILKDGQPMDILIRLNDIIIIDKTLKVEGVSIIRSGDTIIHELIVPEISNILCLTK